MPRSSVRLALAAALTVSTLAACSSPGAGGAGSAADADAFPNKPVTWVVPYAAGGNTDAISRVVAKAMGKELGADVIVENKPGGSGAIGMQQIMGAKPDGYTVGLFTTGTMVVTPLLNKLGYDETKFTNVGLMLTQPVVIMTGASAKYPTFAALVEAAKAKPEGVSIGVPGASTPQAYELTRMAKDHGVSFAIVPFDSNAEVVNALRGGNVDAIALNASGDIRKQLDSGDLKAVAVGEPERLPWLPEVPTLVESGFAKLDASGTLIGLTAPAGLPKPVEDKLGKALAVALTDPAVVELLGKDNIPNTFVGGQDLDVRLADRKGIYSGMVGQ